MRFLSIGSTLEEIAGRTENIEPVILIYPLVEDLLGQVTVSKAARRQLRNGYAGPHSTLVLDHLSIKRIYLLKIFSALEKIPVQAMGRIEIKFEHEQSKNVGTPQLKRRATRLIILPK